MQFHPVYIRRRSAVPRHKWKHAVITNDITIVPNNKGGYSAARKTHSTQCVDMFQHVVQKHNVLKRFRYARGPYQNSMNCTGFWSGLGGTWSGKLSAPACRGLKVIISFWIQFPFAQIQIYFPQINFHVFWFGLGFFKNLQYAMKRFKKTIHILVQYTYLMRFLIGINIRT